MRLTPTVGFRHICDEARRWVLIVMNWRRRVSGDAGWLSISATEHGNGLIIETEVSQLWGRGESFLKKLRSTTP